MKNREKKAATAEKRRQRMVLILCVAILALAIVAVNVRTVVYGYYDSFVRRAWTWTRAASHLQALARRWGCSVGRAPSRMGQLAVQPPSGIGDDRGPGRNRAARIPIR